jgi:hypothetical protein
LVRDYLRELEAKLDDIAPLVEKKEVKIEIVSEEVAVVKGMIELFDGSILNFMELVSPGERNYRFHWMDDKKELICRWDTAPHHRVKSFPHHKHMQSGVESSKAKRLIDVLAEIERELMKKE